jgi:hypothetical protein
MYSIHTVGETVSVPWTNRRIREVEGEVCGLASSLQERQRRYERSCEKLAGVRDISRTLAKCHMLLNEVRTLYFMKSCQLKVPCSAAVVSLCFIRCSICHSNLVRLVILVFISYLMYSWKLDH